MAEKRFSRVPTYTRLSKFQISLMHTRAMRPECAPIFLPLFDHCIALALDSHRAFKSATYSGREWLARRAGRELAHARKVAQHAPARPTERAPAPAAVPCDCWQGTSALRVC